MNAKEWLIKNGFNMIESPDGQEGFEPIVGMGALIDSFDEWFFPTILEAEKNGDSVYQALMNQETRGWEMFFEKWKEQGIIN